MWISKTFVRGVLVMLVAACCMPSYAIAAESKTVTEASESSERTVVVGCIDYGGFVQQTEQGFFEGYGVDYLNEISKITGWNIEFRSYAWEDLVGVKDGQTGERTGSALLSGEVDFVMHAQKTNAREQDFLYADYPTGYENTVVYARTDEKNLFYDDPEGLQGKRVGVLSGSFQTESFAAYAQKRGIAFAEVEFPDDSSMREALERGEVDAIVTGSLAYYDEFKVVLREGAEPYYFMTAKGNDALMDELNDAMSEIITKEPSFQGDLAEKWYGAAAAYSTPLFTREEVDYIARAGTITIGNLPRREPLSSVDEQTGKMTGINESLLDEVARVSGLSFSYEAVGETDNPVDALKRGSFDLVAGVVRTDDFAADPDLVLSDAFLESNIVSVVRRGVTFDPEADLTIALPVAFKALDDYLSTYRPNYSRVYYDTNVECLQALADGHVDVFMQNEYFLRYLLQSPRFFDIEVVSGYAIDEQSVVVGRSGDADAVLLMSVIDKSIAAISDETRSRVLVAGTVTNSYKYTMGDLAYEYRLPLIVAGAALVCIILLIIIIMVSRQRYARSLEAKNEQLAESVRIAQTANGAKSDFLAQMSHEIRTPMNAIIGLTAIAKSEVDDRAKTLADLGKIEDSSKMLLALINEVLDMAAIENKKMNIEKVPFDFRRMLAQLASVVYAQAKQKDVTFKLHIQGPADEMLVGDSLRLNQVLLNLLSNAVKFTPAGGSVVLDVSEIKRRDTRVFVRFVVSDTGVGMGEDMLKRLFQPFEQESASTARKHGGSGLGLSIAKNLIDVMHGSIAVQSTQGKGTVFSVDLPFDTTDEGLVGVPGEIQEMRALVVDDDEDALRYASIVLERLGVRHEVALTGETALEMLGEAEDAGDPFEICFVDWRMPGMDGLEVARSVRRIFGEDTIMIILSAYDLSEIEHDFADAGVNYYVPKPLFQSTVLDALSRIRQGSWASDSSIGDQYDFSGKTVLVAEDIAVNMEVIRRLLEMVGARVVCVEDGLQAVGAFERSQEGSFDAILMDINMPIMDGYEASRTIRALERADAKKVPLLALTAKAFAEDAATAFASGMDGHLAKPIDMNLLYRTLDEVFSKAGDGEDE